MVILHRKLTGGENNDELPLFEGYGQTECSAAGNLENGNQRGAGLMTNYYNEPQMTSQAIDDFRTER
ncbi:hypothetical protein QR680_005824 [Steinernema hermaphroditum]|uniref:Uncharacterized protein n=1 Tax=Steinernema hermaphroditum TaxID=289476 RepID=A0AA39LWD0_9BILA|nr:hypothetical protein QR680_005824 [Steinernema hermaphroditum]